MKPDVYLEIARYCDANNVHPENIEPLVELFEELFQERLAARMPPDSDPDGLAELTREQLEGLYRSEREWRQAFQADAKKLLDEADERNLAAKRCTCSVRFGHFSNCPVVKR